MNTPPTRVLIAELGDEDPLEHGGYFVFQDLQEPRCYEAEWLAVPEEGETKYWTVYRFGLTCCSYLNGILSDNIYHPELPAWFAGPGQLRKIASYSGLSTRALIALLCSGRPEKLAAAYRAIGEYAGWANLDSYPLSLTRREVTKRYQKPKPRKPRLEEF